MFILLCSPHSFLLIELLTTSLILISRIVTEKPHQGSVNKLLYCIVFFSLLTKTKFRFTDLSGNQFPINFKRLIGLKITLMKFTYLQGATGCLCLCPINLSWADLTKTKRKFRELNEWFRAYRSFLCAHMVCSHANFLQKKEFFYI